MITPTEQVAVDPVVVRRQNDLFDLYGEYSDRHADDPDYSPDDDPEFVEAAREIMDLPPFDDTLATLKARATALGVPNAASLTREQLLAALRGRNVTRSVDLDEDGEESELDDPLTLRAAMHLAYIELDTETRAQQDHDSLRLRGIVDDEPDFTDEELRALDVHNNEFKKYWTRGPGLKKWLGHPHEWTALRNHLVKYVGPERADRIASEWFHEVKGFWPGSDLHRVEHGKPPRGDRIGPG